MAGLRNGLCSETGSDKPLPLVILRQQQDAIVPILTVSLYAKYNQPSSKTTCDPACVRCYFFGVSCLASPLHRP